MKSNSLINFSILIMVFCLFYIIYIYCFDKYATSDADDSARPIFDINEDNFEINQTQTNIFRIGEIKQRISITFKTGHKQM